ncbi:hypothetical protein KL933_003145 [Ogataea haglerorum]|uniref:DUF962 domain-containing protein n=1 Tax=Ogataea haglerorum TaxID=1937702 RepID=A0AAN6D4R7_9ASCO|nr:hypothetical protein KL933_003145 [Ogataea haglerorum]KAG7733246.1 hypothetical protein KL948_001749 [Ogataea haglerorum]
MSRLLDLNYQLAYYKAYHFHPKNVGIHLMCIPLIFLTGVIMAGAVDLGPVSLAQAGMIGYGIYYLLLDPGMGLVSLIFVFAAAYSSTYLHSHFPSSQVNFYALAVHVSGWIAQFFGHGYYEKRAPALLDNLIQPLVLAPYFVLWEIAFEFGYRRDLKKAMEKQAKQMRNEAERKRSKAST